ncbi:MAG: thioredoxin-disulfide reductase, partial [Cyclobacteriaceae bacterium]|nr:thioredoxin-disulfide reductase [Cyclobacteriaceae bacterium]
MTKEDVKVLIIGSGPAGYTAAIYAARAGLKPVLYTGAEPGGQLVTTNDVENFPGYPDGINGPEMMMQLQKQAERFETEVRFGVVTKVDFSGYPHKAIVDDNHEITAEAVIISTGATAQYLGLESEKALHGKGVSACAICDGFFYKGMDVAVVGGGDSAAEEATYLANICPKVYLIVRRDELRASTIMQQRVLNTPNIEVLWNSETVEVLGDEKVVGAKLLNNKTNEEFTIDIEGFFVAIGHKPNTEIFKDYLDMDKTGYLNVVAGSTRTNVEGVFVAGDA